MAKCVRFIVISALLSVAFTDDRIVFNEEDEKKWNTPPKLIPEPVARSTNGEPQPRFLPFSATFSLNAGSSNAHSLSLGASNDGLSLSQSSSQADSLGLFGEAGPGLSASQSSSFSAGLSGISASDANSFSLNHPVFGGTSQANSNSFGFGNANAQSHGTVMNGHAMSGAQSGVGSSGTGGGASSGASSSAGGNHASSGADASAFQGQGHRESRPIWTNLEPNSKGNSNNHGNKFGNRPTVSISGEKSQIWPNGGHRSPMDGIGLGLSNANWPSQATSQGNVQLNSHNIKNWPSNNRGPHSNRENNNWQLQNCGRNGQNIGTHRGTANSKSGSYYDPSTGCNNGVSEQQHYRPRPASNAQGQHPGTQISTASASSGASSTGNGFSFGQSSSQSNSGPNGPSSSTMNHVQTSGNAQGFSQAAAAAVGQTNGQTDASFSTGALAGNSNANGQSVGTASSGNRGQNSKGQVNSQSVGEGTILGTANAGSVSFVRFPEESSHNIPKEFVRSQPPSRSEPNGRAGKRNRHPVDAIITEITDSVADLFDI